MNVLPAFLMVGVFACNLSSSVAAQSLTTEYVPFHEGVSGTVISHTIVGSEVVDYVVTADAGQRLIVDMASSNVSAYYNLTGPYAGAAAHVGSIAGAHFDGVLPSAGDWTISVYLMRNAARRNESASFDLSLHMGQADEVAFASINDVDHGPDYWRVVDATSIAFLNVRSGPGFGYSMIGQVANGSRLRNMGCTGTGLNRWCRVQSDTDNIDGWSNGVRLADSGASAIREIASFGVNTGGGAVLYKGPTDELEVQWPSGCTVQYDPTLIRVAAGDSCSEMQLATSDDWAAQRD